MSHSTHRRFRANIQLRNSSEIITKKLCDICYDLYVDKFIKAKSNIYWTNYSIKVYTNKLSLIPDSILIFEIEDAENVGEMNKIEEKLRDLCLKKPFNRVVTSIECCHAKTKGAYTMSSAAHYRFTADVMLKNASEETVKKLRDACNQIYLNKRNKRRSNKYWTKGTCTHYRNPNPSSVESLLRFEIEDAETVRELKQIEEQIREVCAEKPFNRVIKSINCRHVRTR